MCQRVRCPRQPATGGGIVLQVCPPLLLAQALTLGYRQSWAPHGAWLLPGGPARPPDVERGDTGRQLHGPGRSWVVLLIVILIVLALMFGGFQKGTQYSGLGAAPAHPDSGAVAMAAR